jgi:xanthine permease XanP
MLRTVGVITTCQKINDLDWKRPELKSIQRGIVADGIGMCHWRRAGGNRHE